MRASALLKSDAGTALEIQPQQSQILHSLFLCVTLCSICYKQGAFWGSKVNHHIRGVFFSCFNTNSAVWKEITLRLA